jgi:hypothetical protein
VTHWLEVSAAAEPVERIAVDVVLIGLFAGERPLRGSAGRADWRVCGRLSSLIAAGGLTGADGEAMLIPSGGGLRAPLLVALGWGARDAFDADRCRRAARDGIERGLRLRAETIALGLPGPETLDLDLRLGAVLAGAGQVPAPTGTSREAPVRLRLLAVADERAGVAEWLRAARARPLPAGVRIERARPVEERPREIPRGTSEASQTPGRPLVK